MFLEHIVSKLVPLFGIFMIIVVVVGPMYIRSYFAAKDRAQLHETLRVAYEKGQPVPPELIATLQGAVADRLTPAPERDLRRAVVLIGVGAGLCGLGYGLWYAFMSFSYEAAYITGGAVAGAGAIPGLIGLAYLVLWLTKRNAPRS